MSQSAQIFSDRRFCSDVFLYVQRQGLLPAGERLLLAVSGGLDSMVLLHFFERFAKKKFAQDFVVAHLDHALRSESADDETWLSKYCLERGLSYQGGRLDVADMHLQSQQSSLEAVAREARYAWLMEQAEQLGCGLIVTGHTASDQLETVLMHWVRGSVSGLQGMAVSRVLKPGGPALIRPFLSSSRQELEAYADFHHLAWREDRSNECTDFFRNRLRHEILPWFVAENPALERSVTELAQIWGEEQDYLSQQALDLFSQNVCQEDGCFSLSTQILQALPLALQRRLIREILTAYLGQWKIFGHRHIEAIRQLAYGPGAKVLNLPQNLGVKKENKQLYFYVRGPSL